MAKRIRALINHEILRWACNFYKVSIEELAKAIGVKQNKVLDWLEGKEYPTLRQAKKIANKFQLPFAVFYLPQPPEVKMPKNKDFRRLAYNIDKPILSSKMIFLLKDVYERRDLLIRIFDNLGYKIKPLKFFLDIPENAVFNCDRDIIIEIANKIREYLSISLDDLVNKRVNERQAFNYFRGKFNEKDILVFQTSEIETDEMRGISIYEEELPIIVVNRKDSYTARNFTLFHEFVHLATKTSGICNEMELDNDDVLQIEYFCNKIAAECLVPTNHFIEQQEVKNKRSHDFSIEDIKTLSKKYFVSREVIINKLRDLELLNLNDYRNLKNLIVYQGKPGTNSKSGGSKKISKIRDIVSIYGKFFVASVLDAYYQEIISPIEASYILGIKVSNFEKIQEAVIR